ncbi:hypothetical protein CJ030_MR0G003934 [Morella rubra]|uniref:Uncharacterized protein n=1 Tax=Morella rubra TaxID=262757 RepID=A0A6A1UM83_9ROSI|nr:hypothetical protein CJ030_MR0G003934 [Morella rubra]
MEKGESMARKEKDRGKGSIKSEGNFEKGADDVMLAGGKRLRYGSSRRSAINMENRAKLKIVHISRASLLISNHSHGKKTCSNVFNRVGVCTLDVHLKNLVDKDVEEKSNAATEALLQATGTVGEQQPLPEEDVEQAFRPATHGEMILNWRLIGFLGSTDELKQQEEE